MKWPLQMDCGGIAGKWAGSWLLALPLHFVHAVSPAAGWDVYLHVGLPAVCTCKLASYTEWQSQVGAMAASHSQPSTMYALDILQ